MEDSANIKWAKDAIAKVNASSNLVQSILDAEISIQSEIADGLGVNKATISKWRSNPTIIPAAQKSRLEQMLIRDMAKVEALGKIIKEFSFVFWEISEEKGRKLTENEELEIFGRTEILAAAKRHLDGLLSSVEQL